MIKKISIEIYTAYMLIVGRAFFKRLAWEASTPLLNTHISNAT